MPGEGGTVPMVTPGEGGTVPMEPRGPLEEKKPPWDEEKDVVVVAGE